MITLWFSTVDGINKKKTYKTLKGAKKFTWNWVGRDAEIGRTYAISADGVVKVSVYGCTLQELFSDAAPPPPAGSTSYTPGSEFFIVVVDGVQSGPAYDTKEAANKEASELEYASEGQIKANVEHYKVDDAGAPCAVFNTSLANKIITDDIPF